jgi:hypothetical protein
LLLSAKCNRSIGLKISVQNRLYCNKLAQRKLNRIWLRVGWHLTYTTKSSHTGHLRPGIHDEKSSSTYFKITVSMWT